MVKKFAKSLAVLLLLAGAIWAASPTAYDLGDVGATTGSKANPWQQIVYFFTNPDGSVSVLGSISSNGVSTTIGPTIWFQTNQANKQMYSAQIVLNIPNAPNNMVTIWSTKIPASVGFTGGDKFGAFLYDSGLHIIGATGAQDPYTWIYAPSPIAPDPIQ